MVIILIVLKAPTSLSSDLTLTLPTVDGSNGQVIQTDGNGNLSFATVQSGTSGATSLNGLSDVSYSSRILAIQDLEKIEFESNTNNTTTLTSGTPSADTVIQMPAIQAGTYHLPLLSSAITSNQNLPILRNL